jgi:hypothetical protein
MLDIFISESVIKKLVVAPDSIVLLALLRTFILQISSIKYMILNTEKTPVY